MGVSYHAKGSSLISLLESLLVSTGVIIGVMRFWGGNGFVIGFF